MQRKHLGSSTVLMAGMCLLVVGLFSGCANEQQLLDISGKAVEKLPVDVGRFSAHVAIRSQEEKTKQKFLEAKKAEFEAEKAKTGSSTVAIDTPEKMYMQGMIEMNRTLGKAVVALASRDGGNEYGMKFDSTPTPKGVIAESIDSLGGAVEKVGNTPAAVATSVGLTAANISRAGIKEAGDKTTVNGDGNQVTATKTKIDTRTQNTGDGSATVSGTGGTSGGNEKTKTETVDSGEELVTASKATP
jgi:hypothetical protein